VTVVENGILRNFLTTRSPIENFPFSNGHGRREPGNDIVGRQGNLIVQSTISVPFPELRRALVDECLRQGKPYGLVFEDISGGFTMTGRGGPQAFKVNPLYVYRVYADGRPDEVVRGVDIVGTPLTSFSKIILTATDDAVFNGTCGAESGWVPVSADLAEHPRLGDRGREARQGPGQAADPAAAGARGRLGGDRAMKNACSLGTFRDAPRARALVSPVIAGALLAARFSAARFPWARFAQTRFAELPCMEARSSWRRPATGRADTGKDPVFRAMQEEIDRSMRHLVLPGMPAPYFMAYWVQDNETLTIEARYGALVDTSRARERYLCSQVRVGSPEMDNTGFVGGWDDLYSMRERLSEEDDLIGLRRQLWLHTDVAYKNALESLARKQAYLQAHPARDTVPTSGRATGSTSCRNPSG